MQGDVGQVPRVNGGQAVNGVAEGAVQCDHDDMSNLSPSHHPQEGRPARTTAQRLTGADALIADYLDQRQPGGRTIAPQPRLLGVERHALLRLFVGADPDIADTLHTILPAPQMIGYPRLPYIIQFFRRQINGFLEVRDIKPNRSE